MIALAPAPPLVRPTRAYPIDRFFLTMHPASSLARSAVRHAALALVLSVAPLSAQIVANFTGGTGTTVVDAYAGTAGNGWLAGWGSTFSAASLSTTSPLNGGGNYVSTLSAAGTSADNLLFRQLNASTAAANGVSLSAPVRLKFDFRLDTSALAAGEFVTINMGGNSSPFSSTNTAFAIRAYGSNTGNATAGKWSFYNGTTTTNTASDNNWVSSSMDLVSGRVYSFTVDITPNASAAANSGQIGTYTVSIFDGTSTVSSTALNWRSNTATTVPTILNFHAKDNSATTSVGFSVDSISLAAVPEPASFAALSGLAILGFAASRRRRA